MTVLKLLQRFEKSKLTTLRKQMVYVMPPKILLSAMSWTTTRGFIEYLGVQTMYLALCIKVLH